MPKKNSLEILTQNGAEIIIKGETLEIKAFKLVDLPKFTLALQTIMSDVFALLEPGNGIVFEKGKAISINQEGWDLINQAIEKNIESLTTILAAYTRKPREWFLDEKVGIDIEEAILLIFAILENHYDFFTKRLAPIVNKIKAKQPEKK